MILFLFSEADKSGTNHLGHGPVEPPHVYLVVGVAEGLELDFADLSVPGKLVEVHGAGHVEVDPGAVPHGAVIVEPGGHHLCYTQHYQSQREISP